MAVIKVPKPPKKAFNPQRRASGLLCDQIYHLEWAVRHAGQRRATFNVKRVTTEADVASRMAALLPKLESASRLPFTTSHIPDGASPSRTRSKSSARPPARKRRGRAKK